MCLPIDDSVGSKDTLDSSLPNTNTSRAVYQGFTEKKATLLRTQDKWIEEIATAETTTVNWEKNQFTGFKMH